MSKAAVGRGITLVVITVLMVLSAREWVESRGRGEVSRRTNGRLVRRDQEAPDQ